MSPTWPWINNLCRLGERKKEPPFLASGYMFPEWLFWNWDERVMFALMAGFYSQVHGKAGVVHGRPGAGIKPVISNLSGSTPISMPRWKRKDVAESQV